MGIHGVTRTFDDGEVVFRQGDAGNEMYIINEGAIRIFRAKRGREIELATLRAGEQFGELALLLDEPRSASARAVGATTLRSIDRQAFKEMSVNDPLAWDLMRSMGERIRKLDDQIAELDVADQVRKEHISSILSFRHQFG